MPVSLNFGDHQNYQINESRVTRMMSSDQKEATHMGLWDKFKDIFRTEKKADALNELYNCIHGEKGLTKLGAFEKLKSFSGEAYKERFNTKIAQDSIVCSIDQHRVCGIGLKEVMNIKEGVEIKQMSPSEEELFISMAKSFAEIEASPGAEDLSPGGMRIKVSEDHKDKIYDEYRPNDQNRGAKTIEWRKPKDYQASEKIHSLNAGNFSPNTQFSRIGFVEKNGEMTFRMVHPIISFMINTYCNESGADEANSIFMDVLNDGYNFYIQNKADIDAELTLILNAHEMNPYISQHEGTRNMLC